MEIPDKIYLQIDEEGQRPETSCDGVTWCEDRINKSDIEYVRAEQSPERVSVDAVVIPQDECEKQAWFIVTAMRNMNKNEIEMLCKNLLARYDIDLGKLVQHVNQIKDENLTV